MADVKFVIDLDEALHGKNAAPKVVVDAIEAILTAGVPVSVEGAVADAVAEKRSVFDEALLAVQKAGVAPDEQEEQPSVVEAKNAVKVEFRKFSNPLIAAGFPSTRINAFLFPGEEETQEVVLKRRLAERLMVEAQRRSAAQGV